MGPRENEMNGESSSTARGKKKGRAQNSSTESLVKLTPDEIEEGILKLNDLCRIFSFLKTYHTEVDDVKRMYDHAIQQQARIDFLEKSQNDIVLRRDRELVRLQQENEKCQIKISRFEKEQSELELERKNIDETLAAMETEMQNIKEKEINKLRQELSDEHEAKIEQEREDSKSKLRVSEKENHSLQETIKILEENNEEAQEVWKQREERLEYDKKAYQLMIKDLESKLEQMNALTTVVQRPPQFYFDRFARLHEIIRDVAVNDFTFVPREADSLNTDEVRFELSTASPIFTYPLLSCESAVVTFLRTCAIQNFISTEMISLIQRKYYTVKSTAVEGQAMAFEPMDVILDTISNVPAATASQDLSWRLTTVDKLDRLKSQLPSTRSGVILTEPDEQEMVQSIIDKLHHFQDPSDSQLQPKLAEIVSTAVQIWRAVRKDDCKIEFNVSPTSDDGGKWSFVNYMEAQNSPGAFPPSEVDSNLPSTPFVLFPYITGAFSGDDKAKSSVLHKGVALSHKSPAFAEGLQEKQHYNDAIQNTKVEFRRARRGLSSAQSSPVTGRRPNDWPPN